MEMGKGAPSGREEMGRIEPTEVSCKFVTEVRPCGRARRRTRLVAGAPVPQGKREVGQLGKQRNRHLACGESIHQIKRRRCQRGLSICQRTLDDEASDVERFINGRWQPGEGPAAPPNLGMLSVAPGVASGLKPGTRFTVSLLA